MSGMNKSTLLALALCVSLAFALGAPVQAQQPVTGATATPTAPVEDDAAVQALLRRLEAVVQSGDLLGYLDLVAGAANRARAIDFGRSDILPGATRAAIRERDRVPFGGSLRPGGYRIVVDVFVEFGQRARVATWQLDIQRRDGPWQIVDQERLTSVENLYRVALDTSKQYAATT